mmetsp:Transcript_4903/g.11218  ORF Transcript_4903/g.11218 Transcript_4903/m.11218 type:complete len:906 (-) Transcript_4903:230-2947(-)
MMAGPSIAVVVIMALHATIIILASHQVVAVAAAAAVVVVVAENNNDDHFPSSSTTIMHDGENNNAVITDSTSSSKHQRRREKRRLQLTESQSLQRQRVPINGNIYNDKSSIIPSSSGTWPKVNSQQRQLACGTKGWHPELTSGNQNGCSNDNNYGSEWHLTPDFWFYSSSKACCDMFFGSSDLECVVYDRCGSGGSAGGGSAGGGGAGGGSGGKQCAWHAEMVNQDGCTTNDSYPPEWLDPNMVIHMFHATSQECCSAVFAGMDESACIVYGAGLCTTNVLDSSGPAPPPAGVANGDCVSPGWHADISAKDGCTNDDNYAGEWLSSNQKDTMFHSNAQQCCNFFFASDPASCKNYDRGCRIDPNIGSGGCDGTIWVPDQGSSNGCTNDPHFPEDWKDKEGEYVFNTAMACCNKYHTDYQCAARDGCTNEVAYLEVTRMPTKLPTERPTPKPTPLPTKFPTPQPSSTPTIRPPRYYIVHGEGTCVNEKIVPKPYYISNTYSDMMGCCHASYYREKCFTQMQLDGSHIVPTPKPTSVFVPSTVVEITMWGTLQLGNLNVPSNNNSPKWSTLKDLLMKTISFVMAESPICHPGLRVELSTFAGKSFPARNRRLDSGEIEDATTDTAHEKRPRRATATAASQTLEFQMSIPAKCDASCQTAGGYIGKLAFNDLEEHFQEYIESGATSNTLVMIGESYGLIYEDDEESEAPFVSSGTLSYRHAVESDITWMPTFNPTIMNPTFNPTILIVPTGNPSEESTGTMSPTQNPTNSEEPTSSPTTACSTLTWHYLGDGECTNSQNYPELWDNEPSIGSYFLFDTLEECCSDKSPEQCIVTDTCTDNDSNSMPIVYCDMTTMLYHPTTPGQRTCTNSKDYPNAWDDSDGFLFVTAADCCAEYYNDELCLIKDVCY